MKTKATTTRHWLRRKRHAPFGIANFFRKCLSLGRSRRRRLQSRRVIFPHLFLKAAMYKFVAALLLPVTALAFDAVAPDIDASAYVLMDYHTGKILLEKNAHQKGEPASLTKMMTSYIISDVVKSQRIANTDLVTISENAWRLNKDASQNSLMFLEVGKQVSVDDLHRGIIIQSGNDASVAMAEHLAGSESAFAALMNQYAQKLNMKNSRFKNATGLTEEGHYSSAYDLALLGAALIRDFPEDYGLYSQKEFTWNGIKQPNRNDLLWDSSLNVDGIKTGHTKAAGYCLVSSAMQNGMRLIAVVMGANSTKARAIESKTLLSYGFNHFDTVEALKAEQALTQARVWYGNSETVDVGLTHDATLVIPRGRRADLKASFALLPGLEAPLAKGQVVGKLFLQLDGKDVAEYPMVSLNDVHEGSVFSRLSDWVSKQLAN